MTHVSIFFSSQADIRIISVTDGKCVIGLKVREEHTNALGHLHSSFSAGAADTVGALALRAHPKIVKMKSEKPFSFATTDLKVS